MMASIPGDVMDSDIVLSRFLRYTWLDTILSNIISFYQQLKTSTHFTAVWMTPKTFTTSSSNNYLVKYSCKYTISLNFTVSIFLHVP